jgi:hypothetical protein
MPAENIGDRFQSQVCFWRRRCYAHHPILGWWHLTNLKARIPHDGDYYLVRTNSVGMRANREYTTEIPNGKKRIILLGDSYTAGDGVNNASRYSDLLEIRYPHLEVLNFGLANSGTDQQVLIFETLGQAYEADAYIIAVLVENIGRIIQACRPSFDDREMKIYYRPKPYFTLQDGLLILQNQPVPIEKRSAEDLGDWSRPFPDLKLPRYTNDTYDLYQFESALPWQLLRSILERFMNQVMGKPVFILPLPMFEFYLHGRAPDYLERFYSLEDPSRKRYIIDPLPTFLRQSPEDRMRCRFPNDPHYTAFAHSLVEQAIARGLSDKYPALLTSPEKGEF